jgi:hypothetical protein
MIYSVARDGLDNHGQYLTRNGERDILIRGS